MNGYDIGFVGGGRVVGALLQRLQVCCWPLSGLRISDQDITTRTTLLSRFNGIEVGRDNRHVAQRRLLFVALCPEEFPQVLPVIASLLTEQSVVISLAPYHCFASLQNLLGGFNRLVRMAPNAPSIIGAGYNPVCYSPNITAAERSELEELFSYFGAHPTVDERALEAYAVLTAIGPTYFWFQWQVLRDLGKTFGLKQAEVDAGISAMLDGARRMMFDVGLSAQAILDVSAAAPLAEAEPEITKLYRDKLTALYRQYMDDHSTMHSKHRG